MSRVPLRLRLLKLAIGVAALVPAALAGWRFYAGALGPNPIAEALNRLGFWTLTLLLATLACTPIKVVTGWAFPLRLRRMLGLEAFLYACLHFVVYFAVDQFFDFGEIWKDILKRKFITVGFAAFVMLIPLAVTSTNGMVKRLGFPRWKRLHRLVYLSAACGVIHFAWRVKSDLRQPLLFAFVLAVLLIVRVVDQARRARPRRALAGGDLAGACSAAGAVGACKTGGASGAAGGAAPRSRRQRPDGGRARRRILGTPHGGRPDRGDRDRRSALRRPHARPDAGRLRARDGAPARAARARRRASTAHRLARADQVTLGLLLGEIDADLARGDCHLGRVVGRSARRAAGRVPAARRAAGGDHARRRARDGGALATDGADHRRGDRQPAPRASPPARSRRATRSRA